MGRPRVCNHPSTTCYVSHGCRCPDCRECRRVDQRAYRKKRDDPEYHPPLDERELAYLRRLVGLA